MISGRFGIQFPEFGKINILATKSNGRSLTFVHANAITYSSCIQESKI